MKPIDPGGARAAPNRSLSAIAMMVAASAGVAHAQSAYDSAANIVNNAVYRTQQTQVGVSVPGVPSAILVKPADSASGVTQATSHREWRTECASGMVLSGGTCVPLAQPVPSCPYGQAFTGGSCVPISSFVPPPVAAPTPPPVAAALCPAVTTSFTWGSGCSAYGTLGASNAGMTQTINDSSGRGSITYLCQSASSWGISGQSCSPPPSGGFVIGGSSPTPPPPPPPPPPQTYACTQGQTVYWGNCYGSASGGAASNAAPNFTGYANLSCNTSNGTWAVGSSSCTANPPPPPYSCANYSNSGVLFNWGNGCSGYINSPAVNPVGSVYTLNDSGGRGSYQWTCTTSDWAATNQTCTPNQATITPPPPAPVASGCASQVILSYGGVNFDRQSQWGGGYSFVATLAYTCPATASGSMVACEGRSVSPNNGTANNAYSLDASYYYKYDGYAQATCSNGSFVNVGNPQYITGPASNASPG